MIKFLRSYLADWIVINTQYGAKMRINEVKSLNDKVQQVKKFAAWAIDQLGIENPPDIEYGTDMSRVLKQRSFGSTNSAGKIWAHCSNRNAADAMRTLCHELCHHRQFELGTATNDMDDEQRLKIEDEANAIAGRMLRVYGKLDKTIYESTSSGWKFAKFMVTEDQILNFGAAYYARLKRDRITNPEIPFRDGNILASTLRRLAEHSLIESSHPAIADLISFQSYLKTIDGRRGVRMAVGSKVAVIQFEPHTSSAVIEVRGHETPKEISQIEHKADGVIDYIIFSDGTMFPDAEFTSKGMGGEYEGLTTLFYSTKQQASNAVILAALKVPSTWNFSTVNIKD
jgi:hypothetical protein